MSGPPEEARRNLMLAKQREREAAEHQRQKDALIKEGEKDHTVDRFIGVTENLDERLIKTTVGLVTLSDFQKTKDDLEERQRQLAAQVAADKGAKSVTKPKKTKKKEKSKLSFADAEEEEGDTGEKRPREDAVDENGERKKKFSKNPAVDTSFLPDRHREERELIEREELRKKWLAQQETIKGETIEITYSYWDGSGHRKSVECMKGDDIGTFLNKCRQQFPELRGTSVENLMYIKEDLIIPHHYTFYDFIINKARGKSGPLFNFDVHDDVRLLADATVEKDESHAGKVVERSWYNRYKHIFPASRWEVYDPDKEYGSYGQHPLLNSTGYHMVLSGFRNSKIALLERLFAFRPLTMPVAIARSPSPNQNIRDAKRHKAQHAPVVSEEDMINAAEGSIRSAAIAKNDLVTVQDIPNRTEAELIEEQMAMPIEYPKTYENELNYREKLVLAPMVRTGTLPMRLLSLYYGAGLVWSPEVVDKAIIGAERTVDLIFQIGSSNPELAVKAAQTVQQDVSGIDLNCGCPKSFSTGIRNLTVHCRTRDMRPGERALWERLADIVALGKKRGLPVICNGDGDGWSNWEKIRTETNADSVMIARAAERNPSVFLPTGPVCNMTEVIPKLLAIAKHTQNPWGNTKFLLTQFKPSPAPISNMSKQERKNAAEIVSKSKSIEQVAEGFSIPLDGTESIFKAVIEKIGERPQTDTNIWEERHKAEENGVIVEHYFPVESEAQVDGFDVGIGQATSSSQV
ncbi:uncharacterized protein I206_107665 [Kwoniella pini CBS 10737]|uniref:tRNA-dihydrouridine synthase 2 n=1 Tax=Kwoniella pini CBS 10737 TaxID=1296096 RepID=A0AAJ8LCI5_9TREE